MPHDWTQRTAGESSQHVAPDRGATANGTTLTATQKEDTLLPLMNGGACTLENVLFVPGLQQNLVSLSKASGAGLSATFDLDRCVITDGDLQLVSVRRDNGLYTITSSQSGLGAGANVASSDLVLRLWHARMGHLNAHDLKKALRANGVKSVGSELPPCDTWAAEKLAARPFPVKKPRALKKDQAMISIDYVGPMETTSHDGFTGMVIIMVEPLHLAALFPVKDKSSARGVILGYDKAGGYRVWIPSGHGGNGSMVTSLTAVFLETDMSKNQMVPLETDMPMLIPNGHQEAVDTSAPTSMEVDDQAIKTQRNDPREERRVVRRSSRVSKKSVRRLEYEGSHNAAESALVTETGDPLTLQEAIKRSDAEQWRQAINDELSSLRRNGTYEKVFAPGHISSTKTMWTFKRKTHADRAPDKISLILSPPLGGEDEWGSWRLSMEEEVVVATCSAVAQIAGLLVKDSEDTSPGPNKHIHTVTRLHFGLLLQSAAYACWFEDNIRCTKSTFLRIGVFLRNHGDSFAAATTKEHSFAKKIAASLSYLGSAGGYREAGAAMGMSRSYHKDWEAIEAGFVVQHDYPGVVGAVDGTLTEVERLDDFDGFYCRNTFGIWKGRFRILQIPMSQATPHDAADFIVATMVLYNLMRFRDSTRISLFDDDEDIHEFDMDDYMMVTSAILEFLNGMQFRI
ncbi:unnamed protein product [Phytophthora fragariaefolia]|uniref:Unnamed protein product n=1 Tax=Phytophthora fragariaefolia TaxID=1490495 RepID=A0A9W6XPB9_9STRA|nr:unnamed protein product [Phytophthora fragariaefolia]